MSQPEFERQALIDHLSELRSRLIRSLLAVLVGFSVCWNFAEEIMQVIRKPILPFLGAGNGLVFLGVMDKFVAYLKVSMLAAVILTCPYWLGQIWKFIAPALYENEKKYAAGFIGSGSFLFIAGVLFAYFLVYPAAFEFLLKFGGETDKPMITLNEYLSFFITTTLVFGAAFELPLILVALGIMGLIDERFLREKRRYAIVILAVVSAVLTPPDILSMTMLLVPLVFLYEISIWLVKALGRKKNAAVEIPIVPTKNTP